MEVMVGLSNLSVCCVCLLCLFVFSSVFSATLSMPLAPPPLILRLADCPAPPSRSCHRSLHGNLTFAELTAKCARCEQAWSVAQGLGSRA